MSRYDVAFVIKKNNQKMTVHGNVEANTSLGAKQKIGRDYKVVEYKQVRRI